MDRQIGQRLVSEWSDLRLGTKFAFLLVGTMLVGSALSGAVLVAVPGLRTYDPTGAGDALVLAVMLLAINFIVVLLASALLRRLVVRPVEQIARAAGRIAAGRLAPLTCDSEDLIVLAARGDELGELARSFQEMCREVQVRERRLTQEVELLRIEIDSTRRDEQVSEITETDYFRQLRKKARSLRRTPLNE